ncbi:MAG: hypothetical protein K2J80_14400 [Oscillospiraceae bacterium]|nr:hypothetical protein [Oscillospiraceae bacterium]
MTNFMNKLKYARQSELEIQAELEHIERLHRIMKLSGRPLEQAQKTAEKLAALEKRLNRSVDIAVDRKNEAITILKTLSGDEYTVLYRYYILAQDWLKIADEMYLSERSVYNYRKKAIDKLAARYLEQSVNIKKRAAGE